MSDVGGDDHVWREGDAVSYRSWMSRCRNWCRVAGADAARSVACGAGFFGLGGLVRELKDLPVTPRVGGRNRAGRTSGAALRSVDGSGAGLRAGAEGSGKDWFWWRVGFEYGDRNRASRSNNGARPSRLRSLILKRGYPK